MTVRTESMRTADGTRLDADVYVPPAPGRYPVLLMRQPYGRRIASTVCYAHPSWYAAQGFVVVIQDVRGRGTSEGEFSLLADDAEDGAATIAWAAGLPESDGRVCMYGFSYQGTNQLLAAARARAALRAVAPAMIGWDIRTDWAYEGGAFNLQGGIGWAAQLAAETARRAGDEAAFVELRQASANPPAEARPHVLERHRTLSHYHDWIDRTEPAPYWDAISPAAHLEAIVAGRVPTLLIGGWHDSHLPGTLAAYHALAGRVAVRLVIGPWAHHPWARRLGAQDFGPAAAGGLDAEQVAWFHAALEGDPPQGVRLFDLGARTWRERATWPDGRTKFYLGGTGRAAIDERDGMLTPTATDDGDDCFVHDPWRPVPTLPPGSDRALLDQRGDILTFTTAPSTEPTLLAGSVAVELFADADAPDFDLSCTLSRVTDGQVWPIATGHRRVSDTTRPVVVGMRGTCATLARGESLRLSIAGANFPAFPVNPGTGQDPTRARAIDARTITMRIGHGSRLLVGG